MGASITLAGENLIAQKQAAHAGLKVARFIFANVPGLDPSGPVNRAAAKPAAAQIVHTQAIGDDQAGYVNPNQVVYSAQIGSDVGDWDFNWIGLETEENVLFAVAYVPVQQKRRNIPPLQIGNNLTRNFLVVFDGAQALTGIMIDANTWQHDFTVRLAGIDERERQSNRDMFGRACFFGSSLQLEKVGSQYQVKPGTAYLEGIRLERAAALPVVPPAFPTTAWLDVSMQRELSDVVATWKVVFGAGKVDYVDSVGVRHYCVAIADLPNVNTITDRRPVEAIEGPLVQHFAARVGDYPNLRARATTKTDVGLSNIPNAKTDDPTTNDSEVLATSKALQAHIRNNLEDIPDKQKARLALQLKAGAQAEVTTSPIDTTPGRLLKVGDFGLGRTDELHVPGLNIDAKDIPAGTYRYDAGVSGNRPGSGVGTVVIGRINTTAHTQLAIDNLNNRMYVRSYVYEAPAFSPWVEISAATQLPIGVPFPWPSQTPPGNCLAMAGQSFNPTLYPTLATLYPSNVLPDLRGEFIRGWDGGRGADPGRVIGSAQADTLQNITGTFGGSENSTSTTGAFANGAAFGTVGPGNNTRNVLSFDASRVARTSNETRPRNLAFNYVCRAI